MQKEALVSRANSLKRAIRNLVSHTEQVVDEQQFLQKIDTSNITDRKNSKCMDTLKVRFNSVSSSGNKAVLKLHSGIISLKFRVPENIHFY